MQFPTTLIEFTDYLYRHYPLRTALIKMTAKGKEILTYATLVESALSLASGLIQCGVKQEEPVALFAENGPDWVHAYFAIVNAGATAMPLDVQLTDAELINLLDHSKATRILTTTAFYDRIRKLGIINADGIVVLDGAHNLKEAVSACDLVDAGKHKTRERPAVLPEAPASLLYTSGTTGTPKGVILTHANLMHNLSPLAELEVVTPEDRVLCALPLHHIYPFMVSLLVPMGLGVPVVFPISIKSQDIVNALKGCRVTCIVGVPRLYEAMLQGIRARAGARGAFAGKAFKWLLGFSSAMRKNTGVNLGRILFKDLHRRLGGNVKILASGGARLLPEIAWDLEGLGFCVVEGYGLTETSPVVAFNPLKKRRIGSVGVPLRTIEVRIDDPERSGVGEILVRGPSVFGGYFKNPEETAAVFTKEGFFRTGDQGRLDAGGYLYVVGRTKEMIVLAGGKNIYPEELEKVYAQSPFVKEVAILERNSRLVALAVPDMDYFRKKNIGRVRDTIQWELGRISHELPPYRRITDFRISSSPLPRTRLDKLKRFLLPHIYEKGDVARKEMLRRDFLSDADRALLAVPHVSRAFDFLRTRFAEHPHFSINAHFQLDLGVDSLDWVNLIGELEQDLGMDVPDNVLEEVFTVRDLLTAVTNARPALRFSRADLSWAERLGVPLTLKETGQIAPRHGCDLVLTYCLHKIMCAIAKVVFRLRSHGKEHIPAEGPCVIVANHASYLDNMAIAAFLPWRVVRRSYFMGFRPYFQEGASGFLARRARVILTDPEKEVAEALRLAAHVLQRGDYVVVFPEGRRTLTGAINPFKRGIGVIIKELNPSALPVYIDGTYKAWPVHRKWPRPVPIRVIAGARVRRDDLLKRVKRGEEYDRIARGLQKAVEDLARET